MIAPAKPNPDDPVAREIIQAASASKDRSKHLAHLPDPDLAAEMLNKCWADEDLFSEKSDILDEAIFRLKEGKRL